MNLLRGVMSGTLDFLLKGPLTARILFPSGLDSGPFDFAINNWGFFLFFFYTASSAAPQIHCVEGFNSTQQTFIGFFGEQHSGELAIKSLYDTL